MGGAISYAAGSKKSAYLLGGGDSDDTKDKVEWLDLPCPVKYEEIQREALGKPLFSRRRVILFEGLHLAGFQSVTFEIKFRVIEFMDECVLVSLF